MHVCIYVCIYVYMFIVYIYIRTIFFQPPFRPTSQTLPNICMKIRKKKQEYKRNIEIRNKGNYSQTNKKVSVSRSGDFSIQSCRR